MTTDLLSVHPWAAAAPDRVRFGVETLAMPDWGETRAFVQTSDGDWQCDVDALGSLRHGD